MMGIEIYEIMYIISNIFLTYIMYKAFEIFFGKIEKDKTKTIAAYIIYYIVTTTVYLLVNIPIVMLICNIILLFLISITYDVSMQKRIAAILIVYLLLMCIETIVALGTGYFGIAITSRYDYNSVWGVMSSRIISYVTVMAIAKLVGERKGDKIPWVYWVAIVFIPIASLYIMLLIFNVDNISQVKAMVCILVILLIDFVTFYLFDVMSELKKEEYEKKSLLQENRYYEKQLKLIENSLESGRTLRHEIRNRLLLLETYIDGKEWEMAKKHIHTIGEFSKSKDIFASSGNVALDSILNYKLGEAKEKGINIKLNMQVEKNLKVEDLDWASILGNLMDNAIEAAREMENSFICVQIKQDRGTILMKIENSFDGNTQKNGMSFGTTKEDKENHGFGLQIVRKTLEKYEGYMKLDFIKGVFIVTIQMYV